VLGKPLLNLLLQPTISAQIVGSRAESIYGIHRRRRAVVARKKLRQIWPDMFANRSQTS
jgi:hypothetical protein